MVSHLLFLHSSVTENSFTQPVSKTDTNIWSEAFQIFSQASTIFEFWPLVIFFILWSNLKGIAYKDKFIDLKKSKENISCAICQKSDVIVRMLLTMQLSADMSENWQLTQWTNLSNKFPIFMTLNSQNAL